MALFFRCIRTYEVEFESKCANSLHFKRVNTNDVIFLSYHHAPTGKWCWNHFINSSVWSWRSCLWQILINAQPTESNLEQMITLTDWNLFQHYCQVGLHRAWYGIRLARLMLNFTHISIILSFWQLFYLRLLKNKYSTQELKFRKAFRLLQYSLWVSRRFFILNLYKKKVLVPLSVLYNHKLYIQNSSIGSMFRINIGDLFVSWKWVIRL